MRADAVNAGPAGACGCVAGRTKTFKVHFFRKGQLSLTHHTISYLTSSIGFFPTQ